MSDHAPLTTPLGPEGSPHAQENEMGHGHNVGIMQYIWVFIALCLLTSASFFTYSSYWPFHDKPQVGWAFMMAVSCTKAMLVILFFMHVLYEANWKYVLTIPCAVMGIFLTIALVPDVGMRNRGASEERRQHMAESPAYRAELLKAAHELESSSGTEAGPPAYKP